MSLQNSNDIGEIITYWSGEVRATLDKVEYSSAIQPGEGYVERDGFNVLLTQLQRFDESNLFRTIEIGEDDLKKAKESEKLKSEVKQFNEDTRKNIKEFVISQCIQKTATSLVTSYVEQASDLKMNGVVTLNDINPEMVLTLQKIWVLLDLQIFLVKSFPSLKVNFYVILSQILERVFDVSSASLSFFWDYVESRKVELQKNIFDKGNTSDRMLMLEISNSLTDRYSIKTFNGKIDAANRDTFNDIVHYRIRMFIAGIFNFDDNTGLNKYFSTSSRVSNGTLANLRPRDDIFLQDVSLINKAFEDPYHFLNSSNPKQLGRFYDTIKRIYEYLISEEVKWSKLIPRGDPYLKHKDLEDAELMSLRNKYAHKQFFPEYYDLAQFQAIKKGESYDSLRKKDIVFNSDLFNESKIRQEFLMRIYFLCNLYCQLNLNSKKNLMKSIGAPQSQKHITEVSTPESLAQLFLKIKTDIPKRFRSIDNQFSFLLQHLAISESYWWEWLIYNKDSKSGKTLLSDKSISTSELSTAQENFEAILPFKEKRYFNNFVTPQLSRKMKIPTGLDNIKPIHMEKINSTSSVEDIDDKIRSSTDIEEQKALINERNILNWKYLRLKRPSSWLQFGDLANKKIIDKHGEMVSAEIQEPDVHPNSISEETVHAENISVKAKDNEQFTASATPISQSIESQSTASSAAETHEDKNQEDTKNDDTSNPDHRDSTSRKRSYTSDDDVSQPNSKKANNES